MELLKNWPQVCLAFLCLLFVTWYLKHKSQAIDYWPFLGSLPSLLWNSNRLPEWVTEVFNCLHCSSFFIDGPIFSKLRYLVTCHPQNLEYILKSNFSNFPKGSDFTALFDGLGEGIFNVDGELWRSQRKMARACISSLEFRTLVAKSSQKIISDSLIPFLEHVARQGSTIDLQDVSKRFSFDSNMSTIFGRNERLLSIDLPGNELSEAIDVAQEIVVHRHSVPTSFWKFSRWLRVGKERRLLKALRTADVLIGEYISLKRESLLKGVEANDLLASYIKSLDDLPRNDTKFLRDEMLNFFIAGRDTIASGLNWFFWLVAKTPRVEGKILEELKLVASKKKTTDTKSSDTKRAWVFDANDLKDLVYIHAALCESLRLYPPVPVNSKAVIKEDILPDGTVVKPGMQILLSFYSEGKMSWVWGEDSCEFKPERWIDDEGKLSHEPMSKFFPFNAGPRTCLGKDISFTQMKCVVAAVLFNFHVELVEGQRITLKPSIALHMKNGLMVKIKRRATRE